jgi:hypothetical protein
MDVVPNDRAGGSLFVFIRGLSTVAKEAKSGF